MQRRRKNRLKGAEKEGMNEKGQKSPYIEVYPYISSCGYPLSS